MLLPHGGITALDKTAMLSKANRTHTNKQTMPTTPNHPENDLRGEYNCAFKLVHHRLEDGLDLGKACFDAPPLPLCKLCCSLQPWDAWILRPKRWNKGCVKATQAQPTGNHK